MAKWAFLWITDLHFASPDNFFDDPKDLHQIWEKKLRASVLNDFHSILTDFCSVAKRDSPDALSFIAIGGDITTRGRPEGFETFTERTLKKLNDLMTDSKAICIVPGNHDVVWGINPKAKGYFTKKFDPFVDVLRPLKVTSCLIPKGQLDDDQSYKEKDLDFDLPDSGPIYVDHTKNVIVLNINSSMRSGELNLKMASDLKPFMASASRASAKSRPIDEAAIKLEDFDPKIQPYLIRDVAHVTQAQILKLGEQLKAVRRKITELGKDWNDYLRVALLHHHLTPIPGQIAEHKGYEATVDSSAVLTFLTSNKFDLVLTGHKHQPYVLPHRYNEKEMVIIGGATVAGAAPSDNRRGFHYVQVTSNHRSRRVSVCDIPHTMAGVDNLEQHLKDKLSKDPNAILSASAGLIAQASEKAGLSYRDVVSITRIKDDGDAQRLVECDYLVITEDKDARTSCHSIELPPTSGNLDMLRAKMEKKHHEAYIRRDIPVDAKSATVELGFQPALYVSKDGQVHPYSYEYEWFAVNAFALDKLQYARKYGKAKRDEPNVEFTHFIPVDPIERLTVIVQFPRNMKLTCIPTLRIMKVGNRKNSRKWTPDNEEREVLHETRALRFFESLNIAALRVRVPKPGLSYGIQWTLPDAPPSVPAAKLAAVTTGLTSNPDKTSKLIGRVLAFSRKILLPEWDKDLDATIMIFMDGDKKAAYLQTIAAGSTSGPSISNKALNLKRLARQKTVTLEYGEGIAGRAFKANSIRIYQDPSIIGRHLPDRDRYEPNFYKTIHGIVPHKTLIAFPVHLPVSDLESKDPNIYEKREPYGVLNIGSKLEDCPMGQFLLPDRTPRLLAFQHRINKMLAGGYLRERNQKSR